MSSDPAVSGKEAVQALQRLGFRLDRVEGSHHMLLKAGQSHTVVVPVHGSHVLPKGTLASIIRGARVSKKQLFEVIGQRRSR